MKYLSLVFFMIMAGGAPAQAMELILKTSISPDTVAIDTAAVQLSETVVTAYNRPQKLLDVPGSVTNIGQVVIDRENPSVNLLPVLHFAPGVFVHEGATNTNRVTIRGIGARIPYATGKIRAYFNNIPLTNTSGITFIQDIDPSVVQSINVIKGPASSIYGAGLGGTIAITAREPVSRTNGITNRFQAGSFGFIRNSTTLDLVGTQHATSLVYSHIQSDGYRQNNAFRRDALTSVTQFTLGDNTRATLLILYTDLHSQIPSSIDSLTYTEHPYRAAANWLKTAGYEDSRRLLGGIGATHFIAPELWADFSLFTTWHDEKEMRPFDVFYEERTGVGTRFTLRHRYHIGNQVIETAIGGEGMYEKYLYCNYENIGGEGVQGSLVSDNREAALTYNLFLQGDLNTGKWIWSGGINLNRTNVRYTDQFENQEVDLSGQYSYSAIVSPRLSTSYRLIPGHRTYATISHGFAPPSLAETLTPEGRINPEIKPEKSWNFEWGIRGQFNRNRIYYDVGLYRMYVQDLLVAERVGEDAWVGRNAGASLHQGLEAELHWVINQGNKSATRFLEESSLRTNYAYNHFYFTDFIDQDQDHSGKRLPGVPRHVVHTVFYNESTHGLYAYLGLRYVGTMAMNDGNTRFTPSYLVSDITFGFRHTFSKRLDVTVFLKTLNLFDHHHPSMILVNAPSFGGPPRYYYPGLPRHFRTGVSLYFN